MQNASDSCSALFRVTTPITAPDGVEDRAAGIAGVDGDPELVIPLALQRRLGAHESPADGVFENQFAAPPGLPMAVTSSPLRNVYDLAMRSGGSDDLDPEERQVAASVFVQ